MSERSRAQKASDVWTYYLGNPRFFHGTSLHLETSIRQHGLDPQRKPYSEEDFLLWIEFRKRLGMHVKTDYKQHTELYLSHNPHASTEFAMFGSELIRELPGQVRYIVNEDSTPSIASTDEIERLQKFGHWAEQYTQNHKPLMVVIDANTPRVLQHIHQVFPEIAEYVYNQEAFVERARYYAALDNVSELQGADSVYELIHEALEDFPITEPIPPENFTIIKGKSLRKLIGPKSSYD